MKLHRMIPWLALAGLVGAGAAFAQSTTPSDEGSAPSTFPSAQALAHANAHADLATLEQRIAGKGAKVSAEARAKVEAKLAAAADQVDASAEGDGSNMVAGRLATEFNMTSQALLDERQQLGASWGDLMIAHSLAANASSGVTGEQLVGMGKDGMGWGVIAAGLGFKLGSVVSGVQAESRVALGLAKADGHAAAMQGPGARADIGANAGLRAGAARGAAGAGVRGTAGVGLKVGH